MSLEGQLSIAAIVVLVMLSALLSASDTAFTAASRQRLDELERRGNARAAAVLQLMAAREGLSGALHILNVAVHVAAASLAAPLMIARLGEGGWAASAVVMILAILVFADFLPRALAAARPERAALALVPVIRPLVALLGPIVAGAGSAAGAVLAALGIRAPDALRLHTAYDELRGAIDLHLREGTVVKHDRDMLGGILDLKDLEVADIMVHRTKMTTIDATEPAADIVAKVLKSGHTRLPVWLDSPENIVGILHAKDLFIALQKHGGDATRLVIEDILLPPWFVPDTRAIGDQLNAFLRRKTHFAMVVDEYGEVQGLVTLEDIIEEIVGDIQDEHDAVAQGVRPKPDGSYLVDGAVPIRDLNRAFDWRLPDTEANTIAGLIIHEARAIPEVGQAFSFHGFRFEILKKRKHQITAVRMAPLSKAPPAPAAAPRAPG